jgi:hypothetical protein
MGSGKTLKRELAVALLIWLIYIVEVKDESIVEVLVWPIFTFVTAAFGLDQYSKLQQKSSRPSDGRGNQRGGEHPTGQDKYPDDWDNK